MTTWKLAIALILAPAHLGAQGGGQDDYRVITQAQVRSRDYRMGEKLSISGKYQELINRELRLYDIEVRFILAQAQIGRQFFEYKAQRDNLILLGFFRDPSSQDALAEGSSRPVFEVEKVLPAPGDAELFERKLVDSLARSDTTAEELKDLGLKMAAVWKRFGDPALVPLARRTFTEALGRSDASLAADDADTRLSWMRQMHSSLGDLESTLALLKAQAQRFPTHQTTREFLRELGCTQMGGEWLTFDEFKRKLGFVLHGKRWVKPQRKEFLEVMQTLLSQNQTNFILRTRTDREYLLLAKTGKVENGMTREELAEALGLPDRVEREVKDGVEIDQWNYGDRRIYLFNGQVAVQKQDG